MKKKHSAFSLIEVIFVLVILGIVASISSSIIAQVYENYITQEALYSVTSKTEVASVQITNRLTYRIQGTTIAKDPNSTGFVEGTDWIMLKDIPKADNNFTTVEWIGYDNDSLSATEVPGWSGVANYDTSVGNSLVPASRNSIYTPASFLTNTAKIMNNLSSGKVTMADENHTAGLIFQQKDNEYRTGQEYSPSCMGLIDPTNTNCIFRVTNNGDTNLTFVDSKPKIVTERYKLAWSAYALVPEDLDGDGLYNLYLYSNYQPWNGESYNQGVKNILTNNISVFKFTEDGGVIQFKICASKKISATNRISTCKEKVLIQ